MFGGAQPPSMEKINVKRSLQSFVVLPILATNLILTPTAFNKIPTVAVLANVQNRPLVEDISDKQQKDIDEKAAKIDLYFSSFGSPLAGHGHKFVIEAQKNNIPWNLLASIGMAESTGCKFIVEKTNNCFGWGSGKIKFDSLDEAIEVISSHLGGNRPTTAHFYADKDVDGILKAFNPPIIAPRYIKIVKSVMSTIENYDVSKK